MWRKPLLILCGLTALLAQPALAQTTAAAPAPAPLYDAELAKAMGGNPNGMRSYVFVLLKTGPTKMEAGEERNKMFEGHMANIVRLASEKKLAVAGPMDGVDGWRGMFIFATGDIEEARALVATDPVIKSGVMVAEFHKLFASAGLMGVNDIHNKIVKK
jgi:uncharacterized protein YciI